MYRVVSLALVSAALVGCGDSPQDPNSMSSSFGRIESSANELCSRILSPAYKPSPGAGSESDQISLSLNTFLTQAQGTQYEAEAKEIAGKIEALDRMTQTRTPVAKQREAAKDLQASVAAFRAKL